MNTKSKLAFSLAALVVAAVYFFPRSQESRPTNTASGPAKGNVTPTPAPRGAVSPVTATPPARESAPPVAPPAPSPAVPPRTFAQLSSEMMQTPEMQHMAALMNRKRVEDAVGLFLRSLNLSQEQYDEVLRIMTDQRSNLMSALVDIASGKHKGDDLANAQAAFLETDARLSRDLSETLANPMFALQLDEYQKQEPDRAGVNQLRTAAAGTGEPLGDDLAAALTTALYQVRKSAPFSQDFGDPLRSNPQLLLDDTVAENYRREFQTQLTIGRAAAATLLSPGQLALFVKVQERQLTVFQNDLARQLRVMR